MELGLRGMNTTFNNRYLPAARVERGINESGARQEAPVEGPPCERIIGFTVTNSRKFVKQFCERIQYEGIHQLWSRRKWCHKDKQIRESEYVLFTGVDTNTSSNTFSRLTSASLAVVLV